MERRFYYKGWIRSGITFGSALAIVISFSINNSVFWAIIHGLLSWVYVVYYIIFYWNDNYSLWNILWLNLETISPGHFPVIVHLIPAKGNTIISAVDNWRRGGLQLRLRQLCEPKIDYWDFFESTELRSWLCKNCKYS